MSAVGSAGPRRDPLAMTVVGIIVASLGVTGTIERNHWLATHPPSGESTTVITSDPAPAQSAIYPTGPLGGAIGAAADGDDGPAGGVSLSSTPQDPGAADFKNSVVVAQVHALTAIAAVQACAARHGATADCTRPVAGSLGTATDLEIVNTAPKLGEVRVIRNGVITSATAAAGRGIWYAVTLNAQTHAESRTCLSHHGRQACANPTW